MTKSRQTGVALTGIVLAGGRSIRLGRPKPLVTLGGRSTLARIADALGGVCDELIVVVRPDQDDDAAQTAASLGMRVVTDSILEAGPMAGLEGGLSAARTDIAFVTGGDHPFLSTELVLAMANASEGYDAVVPRLEGTLQPLHTIYRRSWVPMIRNALSYGRRSLLAMFERAVNTGSPPVRVFEQREVEAIDPELRSMFDIDSPAQVAEAERILSEIEE